MDLTARSDTDSVDPEHRQIVRSSDVVFNESAMHKTAERPIEVGRVIFSDVPTLHDGPAHNTRSVSRVTDILLTWIVKRSYL